MCGIHSLSPEIQFLLNRIRVSDPFLERSNRPVLKMGCRVWSIGTILFSFLVVYQAHECFLQMQSWEQLLLPIAYQDIVGAWEPLGFIEGMKRDSTGFNPLFPSLAYSLTASLTRSFKERSLRCASLLKSWYSWSAKRTVNFFMTHIWCYNKVMVTQDEKLQKQTWCHAQPRQLKIWGCVKKSLERSTRKIYPSGTLREQGGKIPK